MTDIHALSGAYAVDALGEAERAHFEAHLDECPACRAEVDSLREAAALLADTTATEPPAHLRAQVLAGIRNVRPLPPVTEDAQDTPDDEATQDTDETQATESSEATATVTPLAERRRRWFPALLVAAAVLTIVGVGTAVTQPWQDDTSQVATTAEQVLSAPDAQDIPLVFPDGAQATVTHSPKVGRAVLVTSDMPPAPKDHVYQLWLLGSEDDPPAPAGLMPPKPNQIFLLEGDASDAAAAAITVEPAGGSPQPTSDPIAYFEFDEQT
ncbi:anti-sigma factor [Nocardioides sp.]|uniref:anti-sigma factor n=1 Tax=Nocardioides sp. TaxID=35761 RepID=UPI002732D9A9|nr:anti-sigma factor [Nocardioides sp.]MDP3891262.1 anti-sigma factor [Nocardioides sp.]